MHARDAVLAIGTFPYDELIPSGEAYYDALNQRGMISIEDTSTRITGEGWNTGFGYAVRVGASGLLISEPFTDDYFGEVHLFRPAEGPLHEGDATLTIANTRYGAMFGTSLGEWDTVGDGEVDILVGSPNGDERLEPGPGEVRAYAPSLTGRVSSDAWSTRLIGEAILDRAGQTLASDGDADGDGLDDLLVGAVEANTSVGDGAGRVYLVVAPISGEQYLRDVATVTLEGEAEQNFAGAGLSFAGDPDGDGYDDILVGAHWATNGGTGAGRAYYFRSPASGVLSVAAADAILTGDREFRGVGIEVSGLGDFTGDGTDDIAIAAPGDIRTSGNEAEIYLFAGPVAGTLSREQAFVLQGASPDDLAGYALASAPDADGDGRAELLIGAPYDDHGGTDAGIVYLVPGFSW